tara:strand:- start:808 stop:1794 length:987 start_codon:yes stop_codon:yes gene_type:complete
VNDVYDGQWFAINNDQEIQEANRQSGGAGVRPFGVVQTAGVSRLPSGEIVISVEEFGFRDGESQWHPPAVERQSNMHWSGVCVTNYVGLSSARSGRRYLGQYGGGEHFKDGRGQFLDPYAASCFATEHGTNVATNAGTGSLVPWNGTFRDGHFLVIGALREDPWDRVALVRRRITPTARVQTYFEWSDGGMSEPSEGGIPGGFGIPDGFWKRYPASGPGLGFDAFQMLKSSTLMISYVAQLLAVALGPQAEEITTVSVQKGVLDGGVLTWTNVSHTEHTIKTPYPSPPDLPNWRTVHCTAAVKLQKDELWRVATNKSGANHGHGVVWI